MKSIHTESKKKEVRDFAKMLYGYLKEHCIGRELSTSELVIEAVEPDPSFNKEGRLINPNTPFYPFLEDDLWAVHDALWAKVQQGRKYVMDFSKYEGLEVGFPFNIPFVFRARKK